MSDVRERLQTALGAGYRMERELGAGGMSVTRVRAARERIAALTAEPRIN